MKRYWLIGIVGLVAAALGYYLIYAIKTSGYRELEQSSAPNLAWLKMEYHISDAEFQRVSALHGAYVSACAERCRQIDAKNGELQKLIAISTSVTPEIERLLGEAAKLRAACQTEMLKHFFEVSRAMPQEEGKRYLDWVCCQTLIPQHSSMIPTVSPHSAHEHPGH
jgi:hypothetical protein